MSLYFRKLALSLLMLSGLPISHGQDIVGQWQGTVQAASPYRVVVKVLKSDDQLRAAIIWINQSPEYYPVKIISDSNQKVAFSIFADYAVFDGRISGDRDLMSRTWTGGGESVKVDFHRATTEDSWLAKSTVRMVAVAPRVSLEVVDWGGNGPPLVFLSGLGNTAHIFDTFGPKFIPEYHVFGITRRGYGVSSSPAPDPVNYRADQLGDDILKVIDILGLKKPVLVGHSIAGEELSSIGSRYPARIAGLIYLDAGYPFALYSADVGDTRLDAKEVQRQLDTYLSASPGADRRRIVADLLSQLALLQKGLELIRSMMHCIQIAPVSSGTTLL